MGFVENGLLSNKNNSDSSNNKALPFQSVQKIKMIWKYISEQLYSFQIDNCGQVDVHDSLKGSLLWIHLAVSVSATKNWPW